MRLRMTAIAAMMMAGAVPAHAQGPAAERIVYPNSAEAVAKLLQEAGYRAEIKTSKAGAKYVVSAASGNEFSIYLYGCKQGLECDSFEFYSWYKKQPYFTPALVNDWNEAKRFLKATIDKQGDLSEYLYVSTLGGMTYKNFVDYVDWYVAMDAELAKFLSERDPAKKK